MIASSLLPEIINISHTILLEVKSITLTTHSDRRMCVVTVYRRPQLPMAMFLQLLDRYLSMIPHHIMPTVVLGDFNDNLLSTTNSSQLRCPPKDSHNL